MRVALLILLALAGCGKQEDFDTRYDKTAQNILDRANAIDARIANAADNAVPPP